MADANVSQLEINGTTYDICDATARDSLSQNYLPLTAGSDKPLTGNLTIANADHPRVWLKSTNVDVSAADNGVSEWFYPGILWADNEERIFTRIESRINPDGTIGSYWYVRNYDTSGERVGQQGILIQMDKTGDLVYSVDNPLAFRQALVRGTTSNSTFFRGDGQLTNIIKNSYFTTQWEDVDLIQSNNGITTSGSAKWPAGAIVSDKANRSIAFLGGMAGNDGNTGVGIFSYNCNANGDQVGSNYIVAKVNKSGVKSYDIADASAFRKAIQVDSYWTVGKTTATIGKASGSNVSVTAPTISGYSFWCWFYFATNGWVGSVYSAGIVSNPTGIWVVGNSTGATSGTGTVDCYALYKRN